jgi:DNA helicase-2/ATP-dependent DNA helicase PcrA
MKSDPDQLALSIRRPMPNHANPFAARGTQFHSWIERHFQLSTLFDDDIFDPQPIADLALQDLKDKWLASEWAHRVPVGVEIGFETVLAGLVVKGRIDAIYSTGDESFEVIDWKTGKEKSGDDLAQAAIQLAVYRLAYAKLHGVALEKVTAGFHYVNENVTIRPADLLDEAGLISLIQSVDLNTDR